MSIRYDKTYNREIARVVKNFNQKRNRAIKRGFTHLPPRLLVSELKSRYASRAQLNKELRKIEAFNKRKDSLEVVELSGGVKAINWQLDYLKRNIEGAKQYFDREIKEMSKHDTVYDIGRRARLDTLRRQRNLLDLELSELSQSDFNTFQATINKYVQSNYRNERSFRGFMSVIEESMKYAGFSDREVKTLVDKFRVLTPNQFIDLYNDSHIIERIFELADSPTHGEGLKFTSNADDTRELLEGLTEEADSLIEEYKQK